MRTSSPIASALLTLTLLLFSATEGWSADLQKGLDAYKIKDYATALREWAPLAELGLSVAQTILGAMYENGEGVPQDYKTAVKWYTLAAEQEHATAQYNLGMSYLNGEGVLQDYIYAHMWGNIAASNGNENGAKVRDFVAEQMISADISTAQELARECARKNYKGC